MIRSLLSTAALGLSLAAPAQALDIASMSPAEREVFRAEIRDYLMENPEVIFEAVDVLKAREAQDEAARDMGLVAANLDGLLNDPQSWSGGNPEGDLTLIEFQDYRCGACRQAFADVAELVESDGNIRFVIKEFPILGDDSVLASRFAIATLQVAGDDAYKALHDALMTMNGDVNETTLRRLAGTLGLDADAILARIDSAEVDQVLAANYALGQRLEVAGTPTFVFGDRMLRGYVPLDGMRQLVDQARAE